ncbi:glycosyltransferase family 4 protein [Lichenicola cladoniae]|uniref:Glycosyltransferase family 4 protein n=1 Tax=Lichenicola cladoniae TaxID=1484109 RepID=A0A6M8HUS1_9PROT|nr:glycosyltransferase family 4 protein [Lichenicola cladoniae]NPD69525.1 glycosyltransferase family 4 protein [Acetobacteraceae bacterium]QKE92112.1 glycosyltransferase family 4 protein [Lichenicola cladoniae]
MKILEITNVDFSLRHFLLPLMQGLRARGHEVVGVCADGPLLADVRADGFRVEALPMARSLSPVAQLRAFGALVRLIRAEQPDLVHAHMPISGVLARFAARLCGVRVIAYTCHGFLFNQPGRWPRRIVALVLEWCAGRVTDRFLTVSEEEARDARRLRIHSQAIAIGNGRPPARFHPDAQARTRLRAELGVPEATIVVIVVSRLVRHKGHPELLAAMEQVPNAELWVVGDRLPSDHGETLEAAFTAAAHADRLGTRLRRLGYRTDIADLLAAADIFALPSHFEGLPMSVIEAMLCGLPVIATDIRGPREQVVPEQTGLLVPPMAVAPLSAALRRLVADAPLRARMGEAGRIRACTLYDETLIVGRTLDLLGA